MARFTKVLDYFVQEGYSKMEAVMLALFFCYYCRFDAHELREEFVQSLVKMSGVFAAFNEVKERALNTIERALLVKNHIAMNMPLKENIFIIVVAVMNQIPVILTGPPGSSKTLSIKLLYENMVGQDSKEDLFKRKPRLVYKSYQCS